jgi:hemolysin activation/secretion protein
LADAVSLLDTDTGETVLAEQLVISGNSRISTDELLALASGYIGKELSMQQLKEIADIFTRKYWQEGYVTSFAYIPAQEVKDDTLEIKIVEGSLGDISVKGNKHYKDSFIENYFRSVKQEGILNSRTMERGLLLVNEYPKLDVKATLTKGKVSQTTDIVLVVDEPGYPMDYTLFYNNFGSKYTGEHRTGQTLEWANLALQGDKGKITLVVTPDDFDQMLYWKAGYSIPLDYYGTRLSLDYSRMDYEVGSELSVLGIEGESEIFGIGLKHPFTRARDKNLYGSLGLKKKEFTNFLFEKTQVTSKDEYSTLELGLSGDRLKGNNHSFLDLTATTSLGSMLGGMSKSEYTKSSRPGLADNSWVKFNLNFTNITKLGDCQLISRVLGQYSTDNLVTAEQFILGGPDTVRGYPSGELLGDQGYFISAELRTPLMPGQSKLNQYVNWAFFVDHGYTEYKETFSSEDKSNSLSSPGLGLRLSLPHNFNLRFDAAFAVSDDASDNKSQRYWLNAAVNF